jgi:manganese/iron transport system permease protein
MLWIAVGVAIASSALGTIVSFHLDGATGACIVLIQAFVFVLAFLFAPKRGIVWDWRRRAAEQPVLPAQ